MKKKNGFKRFCRYLDGKTDISGHPVIPVSIYELHEKWGLEDGDTFYWWGMGKYLSITTFSVETYRSRDYASDAWATTDPNYTPPGVRS